MPPINPAMSIRVTLNPPPGGLGKYRGPRRSIAVAHGGALPRPMPVYAVFRLNTTVWFAPPPGILAARQWIDRRGDNSARQALWPERALASTAIKPT
jgi:hypothetical protein